MPAGAARGLWTLLAAAAAAAALHGCAAPGAGGTGAAGGSPAPVVTASDETEQRRRARNRVELAANYFAQGQITTALDEVKQAIAVDPTFADGYTLRGLIYMQMQQMPLAEESFQRAVALEPRNGDAQHNYGVFLCRERRYTESFARFQQAIAVPGYFGLATSHFALGACQLQAGQLAQAEASLYRAFELDPANPAVATNLALVHFRKGDAERARFYARKVNNSEFANAESLWLGMRIERALGSESTVEQLGAQLRRRFPNSRELRAYDRGAFNEP
jgi:type IV pilus assembly protein PilF